MQSVAVSYDVTRDQKRQSLATLTGQERADAEEIDALRQVSAELAARIQAAQAHSTVRRVSGAGLIWPVQAPITSPFGWRWGRMHDGVDLGAADRIIGTSARRRGHAAAL